MPKSDNKQEKCIHNWMIKPQNGPASYGRCRYCGAVALFSNNCNYSFLRDKQPCDNPIGQHVK